MQVTGQTPSSVRTGSLGRDATRMWLLAIGMFGAVSGYLRELSLAAAFGAGSSTDAFFIAVSIPTVASDLLIGSGLLVSVVPVFSRFFTAGGAVNREETSRLFFQIFFLISTAGALIAVMCFAAMPWLVGQLAPGFETSVSESTVRLGRGLVWLLPVNGMLILMNQFLNATGVFLLPASANIVINLAFAAVVGLGRGAFGFDVLLLAAYLGPCLMLLLYAMQLRRHVCLPSASFFRPAADLGAVFRLVRPVLFTLGIGNGVGLLMLSQVLIRSHVSTLGDGAVSAVGYAYRLYEVPITLISATVGVLIVPAFSALYHADDQETLRKHTRTLFGWVIPLLFPIAVVFFLGADLIVSLLLEHGRFNAANANATSLALKAFAPVIVFETVVMIAFRAMYALHRPGVAVRISLLTLAVLGLFVFLVPVENIAFGVSKFTLSFAIAAGACAFALSALTGSSVLPQGPTIAKQLAAAGIPLVPALWLLLTVGADFVWMGLVAVALYLTGYAALAWRLTPEIGRPALAAVKSAARSVVRL